ncbi:MAG: metallophosphoesterase [Nitrospiria bacterium]
MKETETIRFVHISDTHIGPIPEFSLYGVRTFQALERLIHAINQIPTRPDFIIHTGDVSASPDSDAYRLASRLFNQFTCPVYFIAGNHDSAREIRRYLHMGPKEDLTDEKDRLAYQLEIGGHRIIMLDTCQPDEDDPRGVLPEPQLEILRGEVQAGERPLTLFVHFPPIRLDSLWLDQEMLLVNGEALHQTLLPAAGRLRGVFFGHIHRGIQVLKNGILYSGVGSTFCQFTAWPHDAKAGYEPDSPAYFNYVTLLPDQTIVKEHGV